MTRLRARLRALIGGYFWTDCPLCGISFGGHEWRGSSTVDGHMISVPPGRAICPGCSVEGAGCRAWLEASDEALTGRLRQACLACFTAHTQG